MTLCTIVIAKAAQRAAQGKLQYGRAFTELCAQVTGDAAALQMHRSAIPDLYDTWMSGLGRVNKNDQSRAAQISKLRTFWDFGFTFRLAGVAFVDNWLNNRVPNVALAMMPTELRKRINRGYI
jgi:hypothetical protein